MYFESFLLRCAAAVLTFVIGSFDTAFCQSIAYTDSLRNKVETPSYPENYDAAIALVRAVVSGNLPAADSFAVRAHSLALQNRDSARIVESGRIQGQILVRQGRNADAIPVLEKVLPIARRHRSKDIKSILDNLGIAYSLVAEYDKALGAHIESLELKEQDNDSLQIGFTLNNIGLVYFRMANHEEALAHYLQSLRYRENLKVRDDFSVLLNNIGFCYNNLKDFEEGFRFFTMALEECGENCPEIVKMQSYLGLGMSLFEQRRYDEALPRLDSARIIAERSFHTRYEAEALYLMSMIDVDQNRLAQAHERLTQLEQTLLAGENKELLMGVYQQHARVFEAWGDYRKSSEFYKKYVQINEAIYDERFVSRISRMRSTYEQRQNRATIRAREQTIRQQREVNLYTTIAAALAVILVVVLIRTNHITRKVNRQLSDAKSIILDQNRLLEVKNKDLDSKVEKKTEELKLVNLSLKETNREVDNFIHRTSHDIRGPLASLKGICNVALMDVKDPVTVEYLEKINETAENLSATLQRLLVINRITNARLRYSKIDLHLLLDEVESIRNGKGGLPPNLEVTRSIAEGTVLYADKEVLQLLLQNALDRVVKHAATTPGSSFFASFRIETIKFGRVQILVTDNGNIVAETQRRKFGLFYDEERYHKDDYDIYFVKTAAAKMGAHVDRHKNQDGYNELVIVLSSEPPELSSPDTGSGGMKRLT